MASAVTLPTSDSQVRPAGLPQASALGTNTVEVPITVPRIGASWALSWSMRAGVADRHDRLDVPRAQPRRLGVDRRERVAHVERAERARGGQRRQVVVGEADHAELDAVEVEDLGG